MNTPEIIRITADANGDQLVSARELYEFLGIKKRFSAWWKQYADMFIRNEDYTGVPQGTPVIGGNGNTQYLDDYAIKIDIAKHISMLTKTEKGTEARNYFIQLEKLWNSPEMVTKRALEFQQKKIENLQLENEQLKPKALFADSVSASHTSILVGELAKLVKQNGVNIGANRLFCWLRDNGYLIKRKGTDWNMPTQLSMEQGLFEIKETVVSHSDGHTSISKTPKVTGKGQVYFVNKLLDIA